MTVKGMQARVEHEGTEVRIIFTMTIEEFVRMAEELKKQKATVKPKQLSDEDKLARITAKKDELYKKIRAWQDGHPEKYPRRMYKDFYKYWSVPNKSDKIIRYDKEEFFDMGRRLSTYWGFVKEEDRSKMWEEHEAQNKI